MRLMMDDPDISLPLDDSERTRVLRLLNARTEPERRGPSSPTPEEVAEHI